MDERQEAEGSEGASSSRRGLQARRPAPRIATSGPALTTSPSSSSALDAVVPSLSNLHVHSGSHPAPQPYWDPTNPLPPLRTVAGGVPFATPTINYGALTPLQQQMVLNAQRQIMDVAVQQHQQRQFDAFQALSQREQPQPHPFFGLPPSSNAQGGGSTLTPSATDFARPPLPGLPDFLLSSDLPFRRDEAYAPKAPSLDSTSPFSLPSSSFGLYDSQFAPSFRAGSINSFPSDAALFGFERDIGEQEDLGDENLEDDGDDGEGASSSSAPREPSERRQRNTAASARFRLKKKQRAIELQETILQLEARAEQLEREAGELRKENAWLKEMVALKRSVAMGNRSFSGAETIPAPSFSLDLPRMPPTMTPSSRSGSGRPSASRYDGRALDSTDGRGDEDG